MAIDSSVKYTNTNIDVAGIENLTTFDTFYINRYVDPFINGNAFVFITRPELFIYPYNDVQDPLKKAAYNNMVKDTFFSQFLASEVLNDNDLIISSQLSYVKDIPTGFKSGYLPIFTNRIRNFDASDVVMDQNDTYDTKQGYRMPLPTHKTNSESSNVLNMGFTETSNLDVLKTAGVWVNYISNITDGTFRANPEMVKENRVDYMSSIYYIVLEPDGESIKYWAKYTGCWPLSIPYGNLSYSRGERSISEVDIQFAYTTKEDMNPLILEDFNKVSLDIPLEFANQSDEETDYPIRGSKYLNQASLIRLANSTYSDLNNRPPLIYIKEGAEGLSGRTTKGAKYVLSFGKAEGGAVSYQEELYGRGYYIDKDELLSSNIEGNDE